MKEIFVVCRGGEGALNLLNTHTGSWSYWIYEKEVSTRRGLIRTVRYLSEKDWITTRHLRELIDLAHSIVEKTV